MSSSEEGEEKNPTEDIPSTEDLYTLHKTNWLNDEIVNFYLNMVKARSNENENLPNVYAFNSYFYERLQTKGYDGMRKYFRREAKEFDLFNFDMIFVPIHYKFPVGHEHWALALIDLKKRGAYYYDSLRRDNSKILENLLNYLESVHMDKKKAPFDTSDFTNENVKDIPTQENGYDCGIFMLKYAEYLSRNASITFTQKDMPQFRKRMVYEIVQNNII